jgi:hypothetical protein
MRRVMNSPTFLANSSVTGKRVTPSLAEQAACWSFEQLN